MHEKEQVIQNTNTNAASNNEIQNAFQIQKLNAKRMRVAEANEYYFQASKLGLDICEYIMRFCALILVNGLMDYLQEHDEDVNTSYIKRDLEPLSIILLNKKLSFGHWELIIKNFFPSSNLAVEFVKFRFGKGGNENKGYDRSPYAYFYNLLFEVYKILYYGDPTIRIDQGRPVENLLSTTRNKVEGHGVLAFNDEINRGNYELIESRAALMMQVHEDIVNHVKARKINENDIEITVFNSGGNDGKLNIDLASLPPKTGNATINAISVLFDSYEKYKKVKSLNFNSGERFVEKQQIDCFNKVYKLLEDNPTQVVLDKHFNDKQQYISVIEELNRKINDKLLYNQPLHSYIVGKILPESDKHVFLLESEKPIGKTVFAKVNNIRGFIDECFVPDGKKKLTEDYVVLTIGFGEYEGKGLLKHSRFVEEIHEQFMCYLLKDKGILNPTNQLLNDRILLQSKNENNAHEFRNYFEQCKEVAGKTIILILDNINYFSKNKRVSDISLPSLIEAINSLTGMYCFFFARHDDMLAVDLGSKDVEINNIDEISYENFIANYVSDSNYFSLSPVINNKDVQRLRTGLIEIGISSLTLLHKLAILWDVRQLSSNIEVIRRLLLEHDENTFYIECFHAHLMDIRDKSERQYKETLKILALLFKTKKAYDIYEISSLCFNDEPSFAILGYIHDIAIFLDMEVAEEVRDGVTYSLSKIWCKPFSMLVNRNVACNDIAKDFIYTVTWLENSLIQRFKDDVERFSDVDNRQQEITLAGANEANSKKIEKEKNVFNYLEEDSILCSRYLGDKTEGNQLSLDNEIILTEFVLFFVSKDLLKKDSVWQYVNKLQSAYSKELFSRPIMINRLGEYVLTITDLLQQALLNHKNKPLKDVREIRIRRLLNSVLQLKLFDEFAYYENLHALVKTFESVHESNIKSKEALKEDLTLFCTFAELLNTLLSFNSVGLGGIQKVYFEVLSLAEKALSIGENEYCLDFFKPLLQGYRAVGYKLNSVLAEKDLTNITELFENVVKFDYDRNRQFLLSWGVNEGNTILKINKKLLLEGNKYAVATGNIALSQECLKKLAKYIMDWDNGEALFYNEGVLSCLEGFRCYNLKKQYSELKDKIEEAIHPEAILQNKKERVSQKVKMDVFILCYYLKNCLLEYDSANRFKILQQKLFTVVNIEDDIKAVEQLLYEGIPESFGIATLVALKQYSILLNLIAGDFKEANNLYQYATMNKINSNSFENAVNKRLLQEMYDLLGASWLYQTLEIQKDMAFFSILPFSSNDEPKFKAFIKKYTDKQSLLYKISKMIITDKTDFEKMLDAIVDMQLANGLTFVCAGKENGRDICKNAAIKLMDKGLEDTRCLIDKYNTSDFLFYYYLGQNIAYANMLQNFKEWDKLRKICEKMKQYIQQMMLSETTIGKAYEQFFKTELSYAENALGTNFLTRAKRFFGF